MAELVWIVTVVCVVLTVMAGVADRVPESWVDVVASWVVGARGEAAN